MNNNSRYELATFGEGCFWCSEAIFDKLKGVISVQSGYSGGIVPYPSYEQVSSGLTGHAEVVQIKFDSKIISYKKLLEVFWSTHDPTTLNRQGADIGTQYRSVIFYHNKTQKETAEFLKEKLNKANIFNGPIVTEISPFKNFYIAEDYHQNYYNKNKNQPYCQLVISPKLKKFKMLFDSILK